MRNLTNQPGTVNHNHTPEQESEHDTNSGSTSGGTSIDPESWAYWDRACAALPPMTQEEITAVAVILRRINARRTGNHPQPEA